MEGDNFAKVRTVLWVILVANYLVAVIKIVAGAIIQSNSLSADGIHSLTDGSSNIVGLIGIHFAARPVDDDHPYGHRKFETMAALFIAGMLLVLGLRIVTSAIPRLFHPVTPAVTAESLIALLITLGINVFVFKYEYGQGKKLKSDVLVSDSFHTRSDIYISVGVLVALIGIRLGLPAIIDPLVSLVVSVFVLRASCEILSPALAVLVDKAAVDPVQIRDVVLGFSQVKGVHRIRSRGRDDDIHVDLHVLIDPTMTVAECHALIHDIENRLNEQAGGNVHTVIHVEPYYPAGCPPDPFI